MLFDSCSWSLFAFFKACSFCFSSFLAASCLHFVLLFWNQTLTCVSDKPNMAPIWSRSRFVTYFVTWKRFSRPLRCSCVKTGRHQGRVEVRMGGVKDWWARKLSSWLQGNWLCTAWWSENRSDRWLVSGLAVFSLEQLGNLRWRNYSKGFRHDKERG